MVNWNLQPDEVVEETPAPEEATSAEESTNEPEAQAFDGNAVLERLSQLEKANKQAEIYAADLRRSVGRVQSLVDRIEKSSGEARAKLEGELESRSAEMMGLLGESMGALDPAILPDSVRQRINQAQTTAQQRAARASIEQMVNERLAQVPPQQNEIPPAWLAWEQLANRRITEAGLDPATFDWQVPNLLLYLNQTDKADEYIDQQIAALVPTKVAETKATQSPVPSAASASAAAKQWWEKLDDPSIPMEEKIKIMRDQKLL